MHGRTLKRFEQESYLVAIPLAITAVLFLTFALIGLLSLFVDESPSNASRRMGEEDTEPRSLAAKPVDVLDHLSDATIPLIWGIELHYPVHER